MKGFILIVIVSASVSATMSIGIAVFTHIRDIRRAKRWPT